MRKVHVYECDIYADAKLHKQLTCASKQQSGTTPRAATSAPNFLAVLTLMAMGGSGTSTKAKNMILQIERKKNKKKKLYI